MFGITPIMGKQLAFGIYGISRIRNNPHNGETTIIMLKLMILLSRITPITGETTMKSTYLFA